MPDSSSQPKSNRWLLRRADQAVVAGFCLFGIIALGLYWTAHGGISGRLIELDHADKTKVDFKVDINTADTNELIAIPEIGQTLAQRIVDYRKQHGPFKDIQDLRHVRGIGPKTLEWLKPYLLPPAAANSTAKTQ